MSEGIEDGTASSDSRAAEAIFKGLENQKSKTRLTPGPEGPYLACSIITPSKACESLGEFLAIKLTRSGADLRELLSANYTSSGVWDFCHLFPPRTISW